MHSQNSCCELSSGKTGTITRLNLYQVMECPIQSFRKMSVDTNIVSEDEGWNFCRPTFIWLLNFLIAQFWALVLNLLVQYIWEKLLIIWLILVIKK